MSSEATPRRRMPTWAKAVAIAFVSLAMLAVGGVVTAGVAVVEAGAIRVSVKEKTPGGDSVRLMVPAAILNLGLFLVPWVAPEEMWGESRDEIVRYRPILEAAVRELERCPDGVLVEVRDGDEYVRIGVRQGTFAIDVDSPRESVHVSVPMSLARHACRALPRS